MKNSSKLLGWLLLLTAMLASSVAFGHGMSEAEKQSIVEGGNLRYLWIGATHMLTGYDHLLFVFGIIFFLTRFKDIVKYITAFTLGHSITLIFATFNAIQINYFLIDAVIALSVCYIAFANLDGFRKYLGVNPPNILAMIAGLGLIHGLGLSTRLQQLPLSDDDLLMNIISFNVGIELGQIGALTIMLLLLAGWRKTNSFAAFSRLSNYFLIFAGVYLFFMQMHGYAHQSNPEEFSAPAQTVTKSDTRETGKALDPLPTDLAQWKDTILVVIPARGDKEYKLHLTKGATFEYAWQTDGEPLFFDFHGEPAGDTTGYFESFSKSTEQSATGSLTASFEGSHGWYWKNTSRNPVTVTLNVKGDYKRLDAAEKREQPLQQIESTNTEHDSID